MVEIPVRFLVPSQLEYILMKAQAKIWFRSRVFANLANAVTFLGLLCTVWLIVLLITKPDQLALILVLVAVIGVTDLADGKIAQRFSITSTVGTVLDRLRDKLFIGSLFGFLVWSTCTTQRFHFLLATLTQALVLLMLFIEVLLFLAGWIGIAKHITINSNEQGRIKMAILFGAACLWVLSLAIEKYGNFPLVPALAIYVIDIALIVALLYALKSIEEYYARFRPQNNKQQTEKAQPKS